MLKEYSEERHEVSHQFSVLWQQVYDCIQYSSDIKAYEILNKFILQGCKDNQGYDIYHKKSSIHNDTLMSLCEKRKNMPKTKLLLYEVRERENEKSIWEKCQEKYDSSF